MVSQTLSPALMRPFEGPPVDFSSRNALAPDVWFDKGQITEVCNRFLISALALGAGHPHRTLTQIDGNQRPKYTTTYKNVAKKQKIIVF